MIRMEMEPCSSNSNSIQIEELESIQAIFCKSEEFMRCEVPEGQYVTIRFNFNLPNKKEAQWGGIHALLPHDYPLSSPKELNVLYDSDCIPMQTLHSFKLKVEERAELLKGEPMLLDLLCYVQELFGNSTVIDNYSDSNEKLKKTDCPTECSLSNNERVPNLIHDEVNHCTEFSATSNSFDQEQKLQSEKKSKDSAGKGNVENEDCLVTTLLQLDHMRSKQNYIKSIQKWTAELGLNGRLLFYGRFIFIILQGHTHQVKEYIVRNKTMIVDVDSKGRPCKERMLSVLCEVSSQKHIIFKEFVTVDSISSFDDFSTMFQSFSMMDLFKEHIETKCCPKSKKSSHKK